MGTSSKKDDIDPRFRRGHNGIYLASMLLPVLLFVCVSALLAQENQHEAHREARAWLEFNHHLGGIIVLILAGLTWLEVLENGSAKVVRLGWPTCLIVIGLYNVILSDRFAWPLDSSGLVESLSNPEILQHKILAVMVLTLGLIELLRRLQFVTHRTWLYLFYGLATLTGGILLGHDFDIARHAHSPGLTISHVLMGLLALLALVLKVLVDHRIIFGKLAFLYPLFLAGLGMQLLLFTESTSMVR
jgi:copper resistance protein D